MISQFTLRAAGRRSYIPETEEPEQDEPPILTVENEDPPTTKRGAAKAQRPERPQ